MARLRDAVCTYFVVAFSVTSGWEAFLTWERRSVPISYRCDWERYNARSRSSLVRICATYVRACVLLNLVS